MDYCTIICIAFVVTGSIVNSASSGEREADVEAWYLFCSRSQLEIGIYSTIDNFLFIMTGRVNFHRILAVRPNRLVFGTIER